MRNISYFATTANQLHVTLLNYHLLQRPENAIHYGGSTKAWEYKLGNRSALERILDQYKEKKPKDPTIAEKFNTYKFAAYKEKVIDLLARVCGVSVVTVEVVREMEHTGWDMHLYINPL